MSLMESISFHHLCPLGPIEAVVPYACADTMLRADVRFGHMLLSGLMICLLPELYFCSSGLTIGVQRPSDLSGLPQAGESIISELLTNVSNIIILCSSETFVLVPWAKLYRILHRGRQ